MKLHEIHIQNFRSFRDETIKFDDYTCLVGPNGAGKSNVLTALNVFFRNTRSTATNLTKLDKEDFHQKNTEEPVEITVTFNDLSDEAAADFNAYYRQKKLIISAVATWNDDVGYAEVRQFGQRLVMAEFAPYFEKLESGALVADLKEAYKELQLQFSDLPSETVKDRMTSALREYEEIHSELCSLQRSEDQFYGWSKGRNLLDRYVQWIYVPAVKDASGEQDEQKTTALGQLMERTIRSRIDFDMPLAALKEEIEVKYRGILDEQKPALKQIAFSLETRLKEWSHPDSRLDLEWHYDPARSLAIQTPFARVFIGERDFLGEIARLGHGMQRSFIVALLQELASEEVEVGPNLLLGIEEPELYQHPPQARHFARLLEKLSTEGAQVVISTHSPYFVSGRGFEAIRMVRATGSGSGTSVAQLSYGDLTEQIGRALEADPQPPSATMATVEQILQPSQSELFFSAVPVLVEGLEDLAIISTHMQLSGRWDDFRRLGCHFVVCAGKVNMSRPLAIANGLRIPAFVIFDSDSDATNEVDRSRHDRDNKCLLRLAGADDTNSLPDQTLWCANCVMWSPKITTVVRNDVGDDEWSAAYENARQAHGLTSDVSKKNHLLLSAVVEDLWNRGHKSTDVEKLCKSIISFAQQTVSSV